MAYLNSSLYNKVYLLEFKKNLVTEEIFAFSLPPQSEEFNYAERISETKTFGGIVFEDYGNDTVKISLSGTTANNEVKLIYGLGGVKYALNGDGEIKNLRQTIRKWGEQNKLKNKSIFLTNLMNGDRWEVLIQNCKIRRSKENPIAYFYNIDFIGINETIKNYVKRIASINLDNPFGNSAEKITTWIDRVNNLSKTIRAKTDAITAEIKKAVSPYTNMYKKAQDSILTIKGLIDSLDYAADTFISTFNGIIDPEEAGLEEVIGYTKDLIGSAYRLFTENSLDIINNTKKISDEVHTLATDIRDFTKDPDEFSKSLLSEIVNEFPSFTDVKEVAEEIADTWNLFFNDCEDKANEMYITSLKNKESTFFVVPGEGLTGDDSEIQVYGFKKIVVTDSDNWDSIAEKEFGNPDLGAFLALFNKDILKEQSELYESGVDLTSGMTIIIPILDAESSITSENMIYPQVDERDNYGIDVKVKLNDINVGLNGDLDMTQGLETLLQAIQSRLYSDLGSRLRITFYGIKSYVGNPNVSQNLIRNSIEETVLADPRVLEIENISFEGKGDVLYCTFIFTDINHLKHEFGGYI